MQHTAARLGFGGLASELHLRADQVVNVKQMQSIIASSESPDCVGLYCNQLLDLKVAVASG